MVSKLAPTGAVDFEFKAPMDPRDGNPAQYIRVGVTPKNNVRSMPTKSGWGEHQGTQSLVCKTFQEPTSYTAPFSQCTEKSSADGTHSYAWATTGTSRSQQAFECAIGLQGDGKWFTMDNLNPTEWRPSTSDSLCGLNTAGAGVCDWTAQDTFNVKRIGTTVSIWQNDQKIYTCTGQISGAMEIYGVVIARTQTLTAPIGMFTSAVFKP